MTFRSLCTLGVLALLTLLAPSCATSGPGAPIYFGTAPKGDVAERDIDKVQLRDNAPTTNFVGRGIKTGPGYQGADTPDRWPVEGEHEVLSGFGPRGKRGRFHNGYDIRAAMRSPVYATADGMVIEADGGGNYGKKIVIDHGNGIETTYAHLDKHLATVGQTVHAGDQIALSGQSGNATTPHVHYEIRKNGRLLNPGNYLPGKS